MPLDASSPEFARLATAWLEGTATAEEAAQLWQAVAEDEACAREFSAAARFEALMAETLRERAGEKEFLREMSGSAATVVAKAPPRRLYNTSFLRPLAMAAAFAVLGSMAWLLWPRTEAFQIADSPPPKPKPPAAAVREPGPPVKRLAAVAPTAQEAASAADVPLPERLDRFFLAGVTLDQVPLQRALGLLQGQLLELNFLNAEALKKLRITVPTEASGRRVTFHSGPISFLKAVRAIAGLGGCDMTVDEATLALILHRETYPQVPNRKDIRSLLASQVNADGTTAAEDPKRVAALIADAASLGIAVDVKQPLEDQAVLPMTRGQWQALQALTEARQQLSQFPAPSFQLYFTNDRLGGERVLDEDEASQMQLQLQRDAGVQSVVAKPLLKTAVEFGDQIMVAGLTFQPLGEATQVTLAIPSAVLASNRTNSNSGGSNVNGEYTGGELVTAVLRGGQGATFNINSSSALTLPGSSLNFAVGATEISVSSSLSHLVIISGPPPTQSPPPPP